MKRLIAIVLCIMLTACAGMGQAQVKPEAKDAPAQQAVKAPDPDNVTINLPRWPGVYAYHSKDPEVIIIMSVKEPDKFPVPGKFTFKRKDGTTIEVPLLQPDKPAEKK